MVDIIENNLNDAIDTLTKFVANKKNIEAINTAALMMINAIKNGNKILSCGNGGSMSDAMHFAEELTGRFREDRPAYPAIAISDPAHISCTANDYGFRYIFSRYVEAVGNKGDVLLAISTSGNSENILKAAETAQKRGMKVIALSGKNGGELQNNCDLEIRAPKTKYSDRVQEIHIKVIHILINCIEKGLEK